MEVINILEGTLAFILAPILVACILMLAEVVIPIGLFFSKLGFCFLVEVCYRITGKPMEVAINAIERENDNKN